MNRLADQCTAPDRGPATLFRSRIVFGRAIPLHIGVALDQLAEAPVSNGGGEKLDRFIETMLADNTQQDSGLIGDFDHAPRRLERGRNRLLNLNVTAGFGTRLNRLQSEIRESTDVDEVQVRVPTHVLVPIEKLGADRLGESASMLDSAAGTDTDRVAQFFVHARMKRRNCARAYEADSHVTVPSCQLASRQSPVAPSHQCQLPVASPNHYHVNGRIL